MHLLKRSRAWLIAHNDELLADELSVSYTELLERRRKGEPIQYITGETEFYGLPFLVTPDVLIPRPETEHLVEKVIEMASNFVAPRIVDVGTGSGAIAVALAHRLPHASITATDISSRALALAEENAKRNGVAVRFLLGDLLAPVEGERFEIIVSNPPYVAMATAIHSMLKCANMNLRWLCLRAKMASKSTTVSFLRHLTRSPPADLLCLKSATANRRRLPTCSPVQALNVSNSSPICKAFPASLALGAHEP